MIDESAIRQRFEALSPVLDERGRRRFAAAEALAGRGGIMAVWRATGIARSTLGPALGELRCGETLDPGRVRRAGGGSKPATQTDPSLLDDLRSLVEPATRGDPQSPLLWTSKSLANLAEGLHAMGHKAGRTLGRKLLGQLDYSLQANRKTREGSNHPDRDTQFHYINDQVNAALAAGEPAISVDAKKKELVGDFKNAGREWRPKGMPEDVRVHDFVIPELGRAVPYGVYDIAGNSGWVSVGIDHDTAAFATNAIRSWWQSMGQERYPNAKSLLITADGGGSNGSRVRLWKFELQKLADDLGISVTVCHLPPGTSKWNKIEHRLFSFITGNWRGKPLLSHAVIVQLERPRPRQASRCDVNSTPTPIPPASKSQTKNLPPSTDHHDFHGDWNYTIHPKHHAIVAIVREQALTDLVSVSAPHSSIVSWLNSLSAAICVIQRRSRAAGAISEVSCSSYAKRLRQFRHPHSGSVRIDETHVKIRGKWRYLYRAIDKPGTRSTSYSPPSATSTPSNVSFAKCSRMSRYSRPKR